MAAWHGLQLPAGAEADSGLELALDVHASNSTAAHGSRADPDAPSLGMRLLRYLKWDGRLIVLSVLGMLSGCLATRATGAPGELIRLEKADEAMGATFSLVLYGTDRTKL